MRDRATSDCRYARGAISTAYFRDALAPHDLETHSSPHALDQAVIRSYLMYQAHRMLRQHLLSSALDLTSVRHLLDSIVERTLFALMPSASGSREVLERARCDIDIRQKYAKSADAFVLGDRELGRDSALGSASSETVPVLLLNVTLSAACIRLLRERMWLLEYLLDMLDTAVPIQMDWRLGLCACPTERTFQLGRGELGVSSGLVGNGRR